LLLATSLAAGLGTARLTQAPAARHVVGPVLATVLVGHAATAAGRRLGLAVPAALATGVVAVAMATVWGQFLSATRSGFPTPTTWHVLLARFEAAGTVIRSHPTPVPATSGVVLCVATGAGLVAVLARAVWAGVETHATRPLAPLVALVPSFGLFCYTALLSSQSHRLVGAVAYLASGLAFVIAADRSSAVSGEARGATASATLPLIRRMGSVLVGTVPAVLVAVLAVVTPLAISPTLSTLKVNALPFAQPGGGGRGSGGIGLGAGGGTDGIGSGALGGAPGPGIEGVRTIDLVDNLQAVLTNRTGEVMFTATTPDPTYWQIAVLTRFDGDAWLPDPTTEAAVEAFALPSRTRSVPGLPALPEPAPSRTFEATVTIANLQSTLLPLPPTTVSVAADADMVPGFGAVQAVESPPGQRYTTAARIPVTPNLGSKSSRSSAPAGPASAGSGVSTTALAPYLQLPDLPAAVIKLAHQIVASAGTPAAEAAALARWFDSGRYRYTLSPPTSAGSTDPLSSFLFTTRAGFCQQFAAAYAVLARIDGLPTRVAVGFTTGTAKGHGEYHVTGADAHVWPEVYLGPATGWTSYEPTPAGAGEPNGIGVNSGSRASTQGPQGASTASTASTITPSHHTVPPRVPVPSTVPLVTRGATAASGAQDGTWVLTVFAAVVAVVAGVVAAVWARRRARAGRPVLDGLRRLARRRRRGDGSDPTAEVLEQWHHAVWVLERARLGRRPAETLKEHAARLQSLAGTRWLTTYPVVAGGTGRTAGTGGTDGTGGGVDAAVDAYEKLAILVARASYAADPCSRADAAAAEEWGAVVRAGLGRQPARRDRPVPV
jgi:hypothetical protein